MPLNTMGTKGFYNEDISLPGWSGCRGLLMNLTKDFMSLPNNHIGTLFVKPASKNQVAYIQIEKDDTPILGIISETVIDEGRVVNGFILNAHSTLVKSTKRI